MTSSATASRRLPKSIQHCKPRITHTHPSTCRVHNFTSPISSLSKSDTIRASDTRSNAGSRRYGFGCHTQLDRHPRRALLQFTASCRGSPLRAFSTSSTFRLEMPRISSETSDQFKRNSMRQQLERGANKRSQVSQIRELLRTQGTQKTLQDEFGLFPGTVIFPRGSNRPPLFSRDTWRLAKLMLRTTFRDVMSRILLRFQAKPRPKFESKSKLGATAKDLYERMNTALARGDLETLKDVCCGGILHNLRKNIRARPDGAQYSWQLLKYNGRPAVLSNRATFIPLALTRPGNFADDKSMRSFIRQVVVRLSSSQTLGEKDVVYDGAEMSDATVKKQDVREFVVIQKATYRGVEQKWKIWGTINGNMTVEEVEKAIQAGRGTRQSLTDALQSAPAQFS